MKQTSDLSWLDSVFDDLKQQYGNKILRRLAHITRPFSRTWSTTLPELDDLLDGGLRRGQLTEFVGSSSTGLTTVALRTLALAQARHQQVAWIDCQHTFDASFAARQKIDLGSMVLVQPHSGRVGLSIADSLIDSGGCQLLVFDSIGDVLGERDGRQHVWNGLYRMALAVRQQQAVVVLLNTTAQATALHDVGLRLLFQRQRWEWEHGDITGYRTRVTVQKNKRGREDIGTTLRILFNNEEETDTTWWG